MLAAAMIVRDEEALLPECLDSIQDVVGKIVIVDTGSKDNTIEIAESYNAEVFRHEWRYNFGLHRNQSFEHTDADFILYIDADERLKPESVEKIRYVLDYMENNSLNFALPQIENDLPEGGKSLHIMPRIFRQGTVVFRGRIQEQAMTQGKGYITNVCIQHLGYALDPDVMERKNGAREDLLRMALDAEPSNPLYWQYRVRNLRMQGEWQECAVMADNVLSGDVELSRAQEQMVGIDRLLAGIALEDPLALVKAQRLAERFPENLDAQFYLSTMYMLDEYLDGVIETIQRYLMIWHTIKTVGLRDPITLDTWGYQAMAYNNLGVAQWHNGDLIGALGSMFLAKSANGKLESLDENMRRVIGALLFNEKEMQKHFPEIVGKSGEEGAD